MKCQKTIDARKFSHQALEEMRVSAVARVEAGESPERVAEGLGINRRTIYRWLSAYHYGGVEAIKAKPIPGAPAKVCAKQMAQLSRIIREKNPLQLKFEYALWTLAMIRELIWRKFNVHLSEVSVGRLMKRIGFSPQRPLYRAWQQDPALVDRWREKDYPRIAARAKREGAQIFFADESGIRSDTHTGTTWAPVGETPIVQADDTEHLVLQRPQLDPQEVAHHLRRGQRFAAAHLPGEHVLRRLQHLVGIGRTVVARDIANEKGRTERKRKL